MLSIISALVRMKAGTNNTSLTVIMTALKCITLGAIYVMCLYVAHVLPYSGRVHIFANSPVEPPAEIFTYAAPNMGPRPYFSRAVHTYVQLHGIEGASCVAIVMESTYCVEAMVRGYHHATHRCVLPYFGLLFSCELSVASSLRRLLRSGGPNGFVCFSYRGGCVESGPLVSKRESAG